MDGGKFIGEVGMFLGIVGIYCDSVVGLVDCCEVCEEDIEIVWLLIRVS